MSNRPHKFASEERRRLAVDESAKAKRLAREQDERIGREIERRREKRPLKTETLPARFVPKFWDECDGRIAVVKEIRRRVDLLKQDSGSDSYQRDILCERAVFICCQLETQERSAIEKGEFDPGKYTQMVNALVGLLRSLGLDRVRRQTESLQSYVASKSRRGE